MADFISADAYIPTLKGDLLRLCEDKFAALLAEEIERHSDNIRKLMTNRRRFDFWRGEQPAPDITFGEAMKEYEREPEDRVLRKLATRVTTMNRYAALRGRVERLQQVAQHLPDGGHVLLSSDAMHFLLSRKDQ